jgi:hypothetical protein
MPLFLLGKLICPFHYVIAFSDYKVVQTHDSLGPKSESTSMNETRGES